MKKQYTDMNNWVYRVENGVVAVFKNKYLVKTISLKELQTKISLKLVK